MATALATTLSASSPNRTPGWIPIGNNKVKLAVNKKEKALQFSSFRGNAAKCQMWPLFRLESADSFAGVKAMTFELQIQVPADTQNSGQIILPPGKNVNGRIFFKMPPVNTWKKIQVNMDRSPEEMAEVKKFQILFESTADQASFLVRNIQFILNDNSIYQFKPSNAEKEEALKRIRPEDAPLAFCASPGEKKQYLFSVDESIPENTLCNWQLTGFTGKKVLKKGSVPVKNGKLAVSFALPTGFYEITFPAYSHTAGISVLPAPPEKNDPFFAIEGILETMPKERYTHLLELLLKNNIRHNRNWTNFQTITEKVPYDRNFDSFYEYSKSLPVKSVFAFTDFPDRMQGLDTGKRKSLPGDMVKMAESLSAMLHARKDSIDAFQVLNEYDAVSIPADANIPPLKAGAWAARNLDGIYLATAAFCRGASASFSKSLELDMLEFADIFTFHTYDSAEELGSLILSYRNAMRRHPKGAMPIWITESGRQWNAMNGDLTCLRPDAGKDQESALWISAKAMEAKACGIARYYPFVLPFFKQQTENFGLMDYFSTPLRSLHVYLFTARMLNNKVYCGDWNDPAVFADDLIGKKGYTKDWYKNRRKLLRARMFKDSKECVLVLYTNRYGARKHPVIDVSALPPGKVFAPDGSEIAVKDGKISIYGGMAFYCFDAARLTKNMLNTDTGAMKMLQEARCYTPVKRSSTPVFFRYALSEQRKHQKKFSPAGYDIPKDGTLHFIATNLSDTEQQIALQIKLSGNARLLSAVPGEMTLAPHSEKRFSFRIASSSARTKVAVSDKNNPLAGSCIELLNINAARNEELDYTDINRWKQNANGPQTFSVDRKNRALRVKTDFTRKKQPGDHWTFPEYHFDQREKKLLSSLVAISFELCVEKQYPDEKILFPAMMLMQNGKNMEMYPIDAPGTQWKHYLIPVSVQPENPFDLIRIGMGSSKEQLSYKIRNLKLVLIDEDNSDLQPISLRFPENGRKLYQHTREQRLFSGKKDASAKEQKIDYLNLERSGTDDFSQPELLSFQWQKNAVLRDKLFVEVSQDKRFAGNVMRFPAQTGNAGGFVHSLEAGKRFFWRLSNGRKVLSDTGTFITADEVPRLIRIDGVSNVRDCGNWETLSGRRVKQSLLYRGGELNNHMKASRSAREFMVKSLGIASDLDLRNEQERSHLPRGGAVLPGGVRYCAIAIEPYAAIAKKQELAKYAQAFRFLSDPENLPCYMHCWGGADRTGTLAFLLNAVLGVPMQSLIRDYEFTSLAIWGSRTGNSSEFRAFTAALEFFAPGKDVQQQAAGFFRACGITENELENFKSIYLS